MDTKTIEIPLSLYKAIEEKLEKSGFKSVSDFITQVTRKALSEDTEEHTVVSDEEKEKIKQRLKDLGYI